MKLILLTALIIHLMSEGGYPINPDTYPHSFQTKAECEAYKKTKAYQSYITRHYDATAFKTGRNYFYGECAF